MKTILLLFQMGSEIRQFGHSGFIERLRQRGYRVVIASRFHPDDLVEQLPADIQIVSLPTSTPRFLYAELSVILDQAQNKRRQKQGLSTWVYGKKKPAQNVKQYLRHRAESFFSTLLVNPTLFKWGQRLEQWFIQRYSQQPYQSFLDAVQPDALVVTVPRLTYQAFLLAAAAKRNIPCFLFFHTNKDVVALSRLDHRFTAIGVWNQWMKEQLLAQNEGFDPNSVMITGCSHFDAIGQRTGLLAAGDFRRAIGLKAEEILVLYTAAGPGSVPAEERFIAVVIQALDSIPHKTRLVVRLNPMDDSPRLETYLNENYPQVITLRPDWHYSARQNLCYQKKEDAVVFNNLLQGAAVCINIPSTLTIECALVGLPVINIGFDLPGPQPAPGPIRTFWEVDYYANVRRAGAALLAEQIEHLPDLIQQCLHRKDILQSQQRALIDLELNGFSAPEAHKLYVEVLESFI